jgi:lysophospholipase L1-like esterase
MFGDSVARGIIYDKIREKHVILKDNCTRMLEKSGIRLKNYALYGCTIIKGEQIIKQHEDELKEFDYVALEFGGNDCNFDWAAIANEPKKEHLPKVPIDVFETTYNNIVTGIKEKGGKPVLMTLPPLHARRFFNFVSRNLNHANILKWLGDVGHVYRWHEIYNTAIYRIGAKTESIILDIREAFLKENRLEELLCEDGMHPNEKGHQILLAKLKELFTLPDMLSSQNHCPSA